MGLAYMPTFPPGQPPQLIGEYAVVRLVFEIEDPHFRWFFSGWSPKGRIQLQ